MTNEINTTPITPCAMNNYLRVVPYITHNDLVKEEAAKKGYKYVGTWVCEACKEEMIMAAQSVGYTGTMPPWANANNCAMKFKKGNRTMAACRCGWRRDISIKWVPKEVFHCVSCGSNLKGEHDYCFNKKKCAPIDQLTPTTPTQVVAPTQVDAPTKVCSRPGCNNPGPEGRKTLCGVCRNTPKEPVSNKIYQ
jgi:hypothetical protein